MKLNEQEKFSLNRSINVLVMGWKPKVEDRFPHRAGWVRGDEFCLDCDMPDWCGESKPAMEVLKKCKEKCGCVKMSMALTGMESVFTDERNPIYGLGETLEIAICLFAKKLFTK